MKICYYFECEKIGRSHIAKALITKAIFLKIRKVEPARDFIIIEVSSYLGKGTQRHSKFNKCRGCSDFYSVEL